MLYVRYVVLVWLIGIVAYAYVAIMVDTKAISLFAD